MSIINAGNTTTTAFKVTADTSGNVVLQSNGVDVVIVNAAVSTFASNVSALGNVAVTGRATFSSNVSVTGNASFSSQVAVPAAGILFSDGTISNTAASAVAGAVNVTLQQGYGGF
jgi:hypothetical protein